MPQVTFIIPGASAAPDQLLPLKGTFVIPYSFDISQSELK